MSGETSKVGPKVTPIKNKETEPKVSRVGTARQARDKIEKNFIFGAMFNSRWDAGKGWGEQLLYKTDKDPIILERNGKWVGITLPGIFVRQQHFLRLSHRQRQERYQPGLPAQKKFPA